MVKTSKRDDLTFNRNQEIFITINISGDCLQLWQRFTTTEN